ncbi:MAG: hypothetical protein AB1899_05370 [Pseudomonadota bacterium]
MKNRFIACSSLVILALLLSGCMPKSFVDPGMYTGGLKTAPKIDKPIPVTLSVAGYINGSESSMATSVWKRRFSKALDVAQVLVPAGEGQAPQGNLNIQMDNVGDMGQAVGKGFVTGFTLGLVGSTVTDGYVMKSSYTTADGRKSEHEYRHAIHSMLGAGANPPEGVETMSPMEAVDLVVDDLVAQMLREMQTDKMF